MILRCPDCDEDFDTKAQSDGDPDGVLCALCYYHRVSCRECHRLAWSPDEGVPDKPRTCRDCQAIAKADHERDVEKDRRAEAKP